MREIDLIITDEEASKETIQQFEKQGKRNFDSINRLHLKGV